MEQNSASPSSSQSPIGKSSIDQSPISESSRELILAMNLKERRRRQLIWIIAGVVVLAILLSTVGRRVWQAGSLALSEHQCASADGELWVTYAPNIWNIEKADRQVPLPYQKIPDVHGVVSASGQYAVTAKGELWNWSVNQPADRSDYQFTDASSRRIDGISNAAQVKAYTIRNNFDPLARDRFSSAKVSAVLLTDGAVSVVETVNDKDTVRPIPGLTGVRDLIWDRGALFFIDHNGELGIVYPMENGLPGELDLESVTPLKGPTDLVSLIIVDDGLYQAGITESGDVISWKVPSNLTPDTEIPVITVPALKDMRTISGDISQSAGVGIDDRGHLMAWDSGDPAKEIPWVKNPRAMGFESRAILIVDADGRILVPLGGLEEPENVVDLPGLRGVSAIATNPTANEELSATVVCGTPPTRAR